MNNFKKRKKKLKIIFKDKFKCEIYSLKSFIVKFGLEMRRP